MVGRVSGAVLAGVALAAALLIGLLVGATGHWELLTVPIPAAALRGGTGEAAYWAARHVLAAPVGEVA